MKLILSAYLLITLAGLAPYTNHGQTINQANDSHNSDSDEYCKTREPLLEDDSEKPLWLDTDSLLKITKHCEAPRLPTMGKNFRIDGYVLVDILVNSKGTVECARLIDGHPMLANSAIDAVKDWTFRSMKQHGRSVAFYGHLRFHYSTKEPIKNGTPCIEAH